MTVSSLTERVFEAVPERLRWSLLGRQQRLHEPEVRVVREVLAGGGTGLDVGAWWGPWTWHMARYADRVVALEPVPAIAAYLERVTPASVEVIQAAASSEAGEATLWVPTSGPGSEGRSSLVVPPPGSASIEVRTVRIDDLDLGDDLRLVKVDVEGNEMEAIRGAGAALARCRPTLIVELEQRFHDRPLAEAFAEIESHGYRGTFLDHGTWRPTSEFDVERWQTALEGDVASAGYFTALRYRSTYCNNFVFRPLP
jgi:FkbM family methyltransferase